MRKLIFSIFLIFFSMIETVANFLSEDLSKSLSNLYSFHPKIKYERKFLNLKMNFYQELFLSLDQR